MDEDLAKQLKQLDGLIRHITLVQDNCKKLADKLIERGEFELAKNLIKNGMCHDNSKFTGIEWDVLVCGKDREAKFQPAHNRHVTTNFHHPEFWGVHGIHLMSKVALAEMVCDWAARSAEQGQCLVEWIKSKASVKYGFVEGSSVYNTIMDLVGLLLEKPFD